MTISGRRSVAAGVLVALGIASSGIAQAHTGGGGGGGGHGGGGHFGGGGGHAAVGHAGGGAHFGGGAGAHFTAGAGHFAGASSHYAGGAGHAYGGGYGAAHAYGAGHAYVGAGGGYHGYSTGAYWGGGYWRGGYWPRAYYGYGFAWFLPILPLAYATYWYGGIPYYYANDVYYTWNPDYSGYTATDPPPVTDSAAAADGGSAAPQGAPAQAAPDGSGQVFMYPKNGQSPEQQSIDKRECQKWASDQVGLGSNGPDYRRALLACVEGRGYSAN